MIRIVQGNPGSGKSYYACNYIAEKCCTYDPLYKSFTLKNDTVVITNIVDLKISHLNFDDLVTKYTLEKFLTVENFEILIAKYRARHVVLIIDEAQKYLDSKFFDKDVFFFFQYHRHLGLDIFLLTQSVTTVCRQLIPLCEFIVEACPRSKGLAGTMRYKFKDTKGTFMYSKAIRKKQETFGMYTSFTSDEAEKPKNVLTHWIVVAVVVVAVVSFGFKGFFYAYAHKSEASRRIVVPGQPIAKPVLPARSSAVLRPVMAAPASPVPPRLPRPYRPVVVPLALPIVKPVSSVKSVSVPDAPKMFYTWTKLDGQFSVSNIKPVVPDGVTVSASVID